MAFDDETEDDPPSAAPLPPEDRLWRHPSELAAPPPVGPAAADSPARSLLVAALASACLAGAVVAVGAMWFTRPTRVVVREAAPIAVEPATSPTTAMFTPAPAATELLAEQTAPALASVHLQRAESWTTTTGIWLDDAGTVIAPSRELDGADAVIVVGDDGVRQRATVAGTDHATGVAVVTVARTAGSPLTSSTSTASSGSLVAVIGAPTTSQRGDREPRFVTAAISAVDVRTGLHGSVLHDAVQLDRVLPDDALGGTVLDQAGHLVAIVVSARGDDDLAIAIPAETALAAARTLRDEGEVRRAWLGVQAVDLDPARAESLAVPGGALLIAVAPDSPATDCGLRDGDVVTMLDDQPIDGASDLVIALRGLRPDATVEIGWVRDREPMTASVTLGVVGGG